MYAEAMLGIKVVKETIKKKFLAPLIAAILPERPRRRKVAHNARLAVSLKSIGPRFDTKPNIRHQTALLWNRPLSGLVMNTRNGEQIRLGGLFVMRTIESVIIELGRFVGKKAPYPGHVWTWDFIHDWTVKGGSCRILSVVDEDTRQAHCLHVARHIGSKTVQALMEKMIDKYRVPAFIRSDNGPEFIGRSFGEWLKEKGIKTLYIDPGSPWQNGYVESLHDKFRRECLGREIF